MRLCVLVGMLAALLASPAAAEPGSIFWIGTTTPDDAGAVVRAMRDKGAQELPVEAIAYYEQGLASWRAGRRDEAIEHFTHATWVDPGFPEAYLALARLRMFHEPRAAVSDIGNAFYAAGRSFGTQHLLLVNAVFGLSLLALGTGLLILLYLLGRMLARVHHVMTEILRAWLPAPLAWIAAWLGLVAPFFWRVGVLPVVLLLAGSLWYWMSRAERRWTVVTAGLCALLPPALWLVSPLLFTPLDPTSPSFLVSRAMVGAPTPALVDELKAAIEAKPDDANLHFSLGMLEKRAEHFPEATAAYVAALDHGGPAAAINNNLGVIAYHAGRYDDAIARFRSAADVAPRLASVHYNLSQAYAKRLFFDKADTELREANRLAFRRVREVIKNRPGGTNGTLLDEPLPNRAMWEEAWAGPRRMPTLPAPFRILFAGPLGLLPVVSLLLLGLGIAAGNALNHALPSFECTNCGRPVCRRCLRRIKKRPYCRKCGEALLQIQSASYSRLVLDSRLRRGGRLPIFATRTFAVLLPGYHALRREKPDLGAAVAAVFLFGLLLLAQGTPPVTRLGWLDSGPGPWWPGIPIALMVIAEGLSLITVWRLNRREALELGRTLAASDDDDPTYLPNAA